MRVKAWLSLREMLYRNIAGVLQETMGEVKLGFNQVHEQITQAHAHAEMGETAVSKKADCLTEKAATELECLAVEDAKEADRSPIS